MMRGAVDFLCEQCFLTVCVLCLSVSFLCQDRCVCLCVRKHRMSSRDSKLCVFLNCVCVYVFMCSYVCVRGISSAAVCIATLGRID